MAVVLLCAHTPVVEITIIYSTNMMLKFGITATHYCRKLAGIWPGYKATNTVAMQAYMHGK